MKKLILSLFVFVTFAFTLNAQSYNVSCLDNSEATDTTVTTALTYSGGLEVLKNGGIAGYAFSFTTGTSDTLSSAVLYGSFDNSNWKSVTSSSNIVSGTYFLSDSTPDYWYYKIILTPQTGDSIFVNSCREILKPE